MYVFMDCVYGLYMYVSDTGALNLEFSFLLWQSQPSRHGPAPGTFRRAASPGIPQPHQLWRGVCACGEGGGGHMCMNYLFACVHLTRVCRLFLASFGCLSRRKLKQRKSRWSLSALALSLANASSNHRNTGLDKYLFINQCIYRYTHLSVDISVYSHTWLSCSQNCKQCELCETGGDDGADCELTANCAKWELTELIAERMVRI